MHHARSRGTVLTQHPSPTMRHAPRHTALLAVSAALVLLAGCTTADGGGLDLAGGGPDTVTDEAALRGGVTIGGVTYILNDRTTRDRIGDTAARNGTFLILRMGMRNTRDEAATIAADQFTVHASGTTYRVSGDAAAALAGTGEGAVLDRQRIDPGFAARTVLAFDVPGQSGYTLRIRQNGGAGQVALEE